MSRPLIGVTIDCNDLVALSNFWSDALGYPHQAPPDPTATFHTVFSPDEQGLHHLTLQAVPEPRTAKVRIHLDLFVTDVAADVARLTALGASVITPIDPAAAWQSAVLADPEGHEFCVAQREPPPSTASRDDS